MVSFRKGDQVLWRGRSVVSPPRDQPDLGQLHPLCKHPGETSEGNAPGCRRGIGLFRFMPQILSFFRPQKLKLLENEYKCLLKMSREAPGNKSGLLDPRRNLLVRRVSNALPLPQARTAAATGTAGCAGTTPKRGRSPLKTAPIIFSTPTRQVSGAEEPY